MSEQPPSNKSPRKNPWLEPRTVEEETGRDILSAVCFKYFSILLGGIFAILLAQPEAVSGTLAWFIIPIPLRSAVYWYSLIGVFGLMGYECLAMAAKKGKSQIKIPFLFIALFGLYVIFGLCLFFTLFSHLLGIHDHAA